MFVDMDVLGKTFKDLGWKISGWLTPRCINMNATLNHVLTQSNSWPAYTSGFEVTLFLL